MRNICPIKTSFKSRSGIHLQKQNSMGNSFWWNNHFSSIFYVKYVTVFSPPPAPSFSKQKKKKRLFCSSNTRNTVFLEWRGFTQTTAYNFFGKYSLKLADMNKSLEFQKCSLLIDSHCSQWELLGAERIWKNLSLH